MYNSSPTNLATLDLEKTKSFIETIDWGKINSCGFYGGEPGINIPLYEQFIKLTPSSTPRFTITNGTWSRTKGRTKAWVEFVQRNNLQVFISSTSYHSLHQDLLRLYVTSEVNSFTIKTEDDKIVPMGRAERDVWACGLKCKNFTGPVRFAVKPGGAIIYQSCDGVYPVVGTYQESFTSLLATYKEVVTQCYQVKNA